MDSVECGIDENSGKSFVGEMVGTDSAHKKTHALLCQEYVLQGDTVLYRIRPRDDKPPARRPKCAIPDSERQDAVAGGRRRFQGTRVHRGFHDSATRAQVRG